MIISTLLAAAFTFTATATGVEKGTPIEFVFAGKNTDRDYESMFLLDESVADFCKRIERAGIPAGVPVDLGKCHLWPVGCELSFEPSVTNFVEGLPPGAAVPIYTGGTRTRDGRCDADMEMPAAVFATYSVAQSPIVYNGIFEQGAVYGHFVAARKLEKGRRYAFNVSCDVRSMPRSLELTVTKGGSSDVIAKIREAARHGDVNVRVDFAPELSVEEAVAVSKALATIDSVHVKVNGCMSVFYRAFLPLVKWLDRKERLQQPFELTISPSGEDRLVFIEEDWSVEGDDPKLTLREIPFAEAARHERTTTCFIFVSPQTQIERILKSMNRLKGSAVQNWYVFVK